MSLIFKFNQHQSSHNKIVLHWFFGLVKVRLPLQQQDVPSHENKLNKPKKQSNKNGEKNFFKLILQKRFRHRLFDWVTDLWHSISKHDIKFHIRAGLSDPADTGQLWAIIGPSTATMAYLNLHAVVIEPDFINVGLKIDGQGTLKFIPLQLVLITVKLFFSPILWQGLRDIRTGNKT